MNSPSNSSRSRTRGAQMCTYRTKYMQMPPSNSSRPRLVAPLKQSAIVAAPSDQRNKVYVPQMEKKQLLCESVNCVHQLKDTSLVLRLFRSFWGEPGNEATRTPHS